jgi:hypothetical protein
VVEKIAAVRVRMIEQLAERAAELTVLDEVVNSVEGALWRARQRHVLPDGRPARAAVTS